MPQRLRLCRAHLLEQPGLWDIQLDLGKIASITPAVPQPAWPIDAVEADAASDRIDRLDVNGRLVLPGFVDAHTHIDKAMTWGSVHNPVGTLEGAIEALSPYRAQMDATQIARGAIRVLEMALIHGTTHLRTFVDFGNGTWSALEAGISGVNRARDQYAGQVDVELALMFPRETSRDTDQWIDKALAEGVEVIGGSPHLSSNPAANLSWILDWAERANLPIDLHIDEHGRPETVTLRLLIEEAKRRAISQPITAGHIVALSKIPSEEAEALMAQARDVGISMVLCPATNSYLQGHEGNGTGFRGMAPLRQLLSTGVNVAVASDNIQDAFHPWGQGDLLQVALLAGYLGHMGTQEDFARLLRLITDNPARALHVPSYGMAVGGQADLVILSAHSAHEALSTLSPERWVFKQGRMVASRRSRDTVRAQGARE